MPCVLVEASFLTHPSEGRRLAGPGYQQAVAEGLYRGIARFLAGSRRAQTL
jgi:N-acetylmuramoyl-L-alanine amidase